MARRGTLQGSNFSPRAPLFVRICGVAFLTDQTQVVALDKRFEGYSGAIIDTGGER